MTLTTKELVQMAKQVRQAEVDAVQMRRQLNAIIASAVPPKETSLQKAGSE